MHADADGSIAVIVPVFNEEDVLARHLPSLMDLGADELVFVDGGSTDGTDQLLEAAGVSWLSSSAGRARQMNAGAKICASDILIFIHIDTVISKSDLCAVLEAMRESAMVGGRFNVRLSGSHTAFRIIECMINWRSRWSRISTGDQAMFVRRSVFEHLAGFPDLPLMEDVEFSCQLKSQGRIACLKNTVTTSSRRWEKHGIMRTVWLMWKLRLLYSLGRPADDLAALYRDAR